MSDLLRRARLWFWLAAMDATNAIGWERGWWLAMERAAAATDWGVMSREVRDA